ncbi:hypothetical protein MMPV_006345 [Pyropia vietnamensis]
MAAAKALLLLVLLALTTGSGVAATLAAAAETADVARSLTAALPSTPTSSAALAYAGTTAGAAASLMGVLALPSFGGSGAGNGGSGAGAVIATGFAAGALLADVFLHVLPHAYEGAGGHAEAVGVSGLSVGGWVLVGVTAFYILERVTGLVTVLLGGGQTHGVHGHGGEARVASPVSPAAPAAPALASTGEGKPPVAGTYEVATACGRTDWAAVKPVAWLNLAADAIHNYADGLAIGAAFLASPPLGIRTSVAIFLHELPQEVSDYALLRRAGLSRLAAVGLNVGCSLAALVGTATALAAGAAGADAARGVLLPLAAGGLLYLGVGVMLPELVALGGRGARWLALEVASVLGGALVVSWVEAAVH